MTADTIAHLKITLDDVKPAVVRRIEVPLGIRLDRLHLTIQAAMGWTNSHLYELRAGDVGWSTPYPDADWSGDFLDARKAKLGGVLEDIGKKKLVYLYDFGDGWEHKIKVERLADPEPGVLYPRLIQVSGRCPPEDCGGPWGYAELLEAIKIPNTSATPSSWNGSVTTSIRTPIRPNGSSPKSRPSRKHGPASRVPSEPKVADPRSSPEGYFWRARQSRSSLSGQPSSASRF
jgi:Plasmid pRiA4b ORF-3-like protein